VTHFLVEALQTRTFVPKGSDGCAAVIEFML